MTEANQLKNRIDLGYAQMWLDEEGILHTVYFNGVEVDLIKAREIEKALLTLAGGKRRTEFIDGRGMSNITRTAREYFGRSPLNDILLAVGTIDSIFVNLLGRLYIRFNRPPYPIRFFYNEDVAMDWLRGFLE